MSVALVSNVCSLIKEHCTAAQPSLTQISTAQPPLMHQMAGGQAWNEAQNNTKSYADVHKENQNADMIALTARTNSSHNVTAQEIGWAKDEVQVKRTDSNGWFKGEVKEKDAAAAEK
jgi:hypothetical protein